MPLFQSGLSYYHQPSDRGLLGESMRYEGAASNLLMPSAGRLEVVRILLPFACSVTNIITNVTTGGGTLTSGQCFCSLFGSTGALVGTTASLHATWDTTGRKVAALASGPFAMPAGVCFVGMWYNGTTAPTLSRSIGSAPNIANAALSGFNLPFATADTGLTTTAPSQMATPTTTNGSMWYVALS